MTHDQNVCTIYPSVETDWDNRIGRTIRFCQIGDPEEKTGRVEYVAHNGLAIRLRIRDRLEYYLVSQIEYMRNATLPERLVSDVYGLLPRNQDSWFSRCRVCNEYAPLTQTHNDNHRIETCGLCGASVRCKTSITPNGITGEHEIIATGERLETPYKFQPLPNP